LGVKVWSTPFTFTLTVLVTASGWNLSAMETEPI